MPVLSKIFVARLVRLFSSDLLSYVSLFVSAFYCAAFRNLSLLAAWHMHSISTGFGVPRTPLER